MMWKTPIATLNVLNHCTVLYMSKAFAKFDFLQEKHIFLTVFTSYVMYMTCKLMNMLSMNH